MSGPGPDLGALERDERVMKMMRRPLGPAGRVAKAFLHSKLTPLLVLASLAVGIFAVMITPREEEPQIQVPMIDVFVPFPGASAEQVEQRVSTPLEKLIWEIPGIEYIYTTSRAHVGMAIVRFKVGEDPENSLVKLYTKLMAHPEMLPPGAGPPLVKPKSIDDVPIKAVTLYSETHDAFTLRSVAQEIALEIKRIPDIAEVNVIGGERREVRVVLDAARLRALQMPAIGIAQALKQVNWSLPAGSATDNNREIILTAGDYLRTADEIRSVVVGVRQGRPLQLGQVAEVIDGPAEPATYVLFGAGSGVIDAPAVTITVSKKRGSNAVVLSHAVEKKLAELRRTTIPSGVQLATTRDYGETAQEKSNELISHVLIATLAVVLLILIALGRREALVVAVAVPVTLALTLAMSAVFGYTLNRVTLFALIFAIGILVDDAIVVIENIHRHLQLGWANPDQAAIYATDEVGNPTILATFTVIAALLPLAFVSGLMGPYMRPIPINASAAMFFSLLVAFMVTPWVALRVLKKDHGHAPAEATAEADPSAPRASTAAESRTERVYTRIMRPLIANTRLRALTLGGVVLLLLASMSLVYFRAVRVKMLPYDNKSEFQVIVDMPEGSSLEATAAATRELAHVLREEPEVTDYQVYVGTSGPINFNGLVRHYFLREGANVADIQVNLAPKHDRKAQSHAIAKRVRPKLIPIAQRHGASIKVAEVPPGPPVLSTMVAEIYGPDLRRQNEVAAQVKEIFETTEGIVDVDWYVEDPQPEVVYRIDREKAALAGITPEMIVQELRIHGAGAEVSLLHDPAAREAVPVVLATSRSERRGLQDLSSIALPAADGSMVPLAEVVRIQRQVAAPAIYHKNLRRVVYVTAEVAGAQESPIYGVLNMQKRVEEIALPEGYRIEQLYAAQPKSEDRLRMKWDGEWQITYEVGRDMGLAFAAVMLLVYALVVAWFGSFTIPLIIMAPIPLTLIGILPGHWLGGVFFTATSMIGFIALAGIIVRNSILLVDFINLELAAGASLEEAVLRAGAVRFRPIVLTAAALVAGGFVMVLDPIFQGLAISLIFGVLASTALTLVVIPVLYYLLLRRRSA